MLSKRSLLIGTMVIVYNPYLPLIPKVVPSPKIKKSFLRLSVWDDELLSAPDIMTFLPVSLPKQHLHFPSNASP